MSACGQKQSTAPCGSSDTAGAAVADDPFAWFDHMIEHCLAYARAAKEQGHRIVGITCEYTPREIIMAAGAVPVCLCGGSAQTIPAAERDLPSNLCPLIKSTYGYHVEQSNPFLEMADLIVGETTCDGKKKMYELMAESRPMYVLELPQKPDQLDSRLFWEGQLRRLKAELEHRFNVEITDDLLRKSIRVTNRERRLRRRLYAAMQENVPPITGRDLLRVRAGICGMGTGLQQLERAIESLAGRPRCPSVASRVRVLMTGVPMVHGAERVLEIIEQSGGLVVAMENCTGLKPVLEDVDEDAADPMAALADKYYHLPCAVMTRNDGRMKMLEELVAAYRPQCVIDLIWQACLTYDVESTRVRRLVEEELGLPYLRIETDYSPNDSARIALRVEALFETIRGQSCGHNGSKGQA